MYVKILFRPVRYINQLITLTIIYVGARRGAVSPRSSRKVAGSIPDSVIGILHGPNHSSPAVSQLLTEISTRIFRGV
jgi:hypothetical protein